MTGAPGDDLAAESSSARALETFAMEFRKHREALDGDCGRTRRYVVEALDRMAANALLRLWKAKDFSARIAALIDGERLAEARALLEEAKSASGYEPAFSRLESVLYFLEKPVVDDGQGGRTPDVSSGGQEAR